MTKKPAVRKTKPATAPPPVGYLEPLADRPAAAVDEEAMRPQPQGRGALGRAKRLPAPSRPRR